MGDTPTIGEGSKQLIILDLIVESSTITQLAALPSPFTLALTAYVTEHNVPQVLPSEKEVIEVLTKDFDARQ